MSANLLVNYESWGGTDARSRAKMFLETIGTYKPDVIAVQEMSDQWYCCLMKNGGNYKIVDPITTGLFVNMTGIIYNENTVSLIENGQMKYTQGDNIRLRRVVWALFEDKKTSDRYIVTSTHLDLIREGKESEEQSVMKSQADEQINLCKELYSKYKCPVFTAGDFNAMDQGGYNDKYFAPEIYDQLAAELTDTKGIAQKMTEGNERSVKKPTFDHIFLTGKANVLRYSILSDEVMQSVSDHYPIFIDVS